MHFKSALTPELTKNGLICTEASFSPLRVGCGSCYGYMGRCKEMKYCAKNKVNMSLFRALTKKNVSDRLL